MGIPSNNNSEERIENGSKQRKQENKKPYHWSDWGNVSEVKPTGLVDGVHVENEGNVKARCTFRAMELMQFIEMLKTEEEMDLGQKNQ